MASERERALYDAAAIVSQASGRPYVMCLEKARDIYRQFGPAEEVTAATVAQLANAEIEQHDKEAARRSVERHERREWRRANQPWRRQHA